MCKCVFVLISNLYLNLEARWIPCGRVLSGRVINGWVLSRRAPNIQDLFHQAVLSLKEQIYLFGFLRALDGWSNSLCFVC